jgi:hypothetical protein
MSVSKKTIRNNLIDDLAQGSESLFPGKDTMTADKNVIHDQIAENLAKDTLSIERRVASALKETGEFSGTIEHEELDFILKNVLFTLIDEQRVAGQNVPIQHNITRMETTFKNHEIHVFCEVHIHEPITAFIQFRYALENDRRDSTKNLSLKNGQIEVKEVTKRFDIAAKAALKVIGVKAIARRELSNPARVIQRTLPPQLRRQGFDGAFSQVALEIQDDQTLWVHIAAG